MHEKPEKTQLRVNMHKEPEQIHLGANMHKEPEQIHLGANMHKKLEQTQLHEEPEPTQHVIHRAIVSTICEEQY